MKKGISKRKTKVKFNINTVCSMFIEGAKWKDIADHFSIAVSTLQYKVASNTVFSARAKEAREISADSYADKAEQVLVKAKSNGVEIQRARELAQHYRWMAGKRNPKKYGDKLDLTTDGKSFVQNVLVKDDKTAKDIKELEG